MVVTFLNVLIQKQTTRFFRARGSIRDFGYKPCDWLAGALFKSLYDFPCFRLHSDFQKRTGES